MEFAHIFTLSVSVVTAINILLAGILIFIERRDIGSTWAWLLILFFIPIVGFIVYLFFGRQLKQKNFYKLSSDEREYLRSSVEEQLKELKATHEYRNDLLIQHNKLLFTNLNSSKSLVRIDNEIDIFSDGNQKFEALFEDIRNAKKKLIFNIILFNEIILGKN